MNKPNWFILLTLLASISLIAHVSAACDGNQIDVNSASLEELDQIYGIGPVKAQAIVDARPFNSLDELVNVNGIGDATLNNIIAQGLACIGDKTEDNQTDNRTQSEYLPQETLAVKIPTKTTLQTINITPQSIKTKGSEELQKNNYPSYALVAFSILIIALLFMRLKKEKNGLA